MKPMFKSIIILLILTNLMAALPPENPVEIPLPALEMQAAKLELAFVATMKVFRTKSHLK